jgi:hypothetical protein
MIDSRFHAVRRRLALAGGRPSHAAIATLASRTEVAGYGSAHLLEPPLRAVNPGPATRWDAPVAFLDGIQQGHLLGHVGTMPVVGGRVAAGVRLRDGRRTRGIVARDAFVVVARPQALAQLPEFPPDIRAIALESDEPPHPIADLDRCRAQVERQRIQLELEVAREFRRSYPDCWLIIDGTITASTDWSTDPRIVGVIKSHSTLWFSGDELDTYLSLPAGHRTTIFSPETRHLTPVHSWALRLWPWEGRDLMHGLVRIETAARSELPGDTDQLARWLLAERAPLADDPRQDRLLYGVHDVERWLRARSA